MVKTNSRINKIKIQIDQYTCNKLEKTENESCVSLFNSVLSDIISVA